ncbi:hypothetical protein TSAR_011091 [Trichomalopsis sarcophagae]|uniref:Glucose-methanol-choline oxidoreductase N-terminal domain-containing protein n=1 Tax=Trichomalopsis sarcophagae TaxID=543379 RepID=A0A232ERK3_9HYME|nr:hypothetical protein TSAR_011091 [Trichomalopsis sarcophagae]
MAKFILLSLACLALSTSYCLDSCSETEESLRQNLKDLIEGKLIFSDDQIPHYKGALSDITPENESEYDFIVIGAGSAGATIASRLSEVEKATVLLIEAGIEEYPIMDIPAMPIPLQFSDQINWQYETESSDRYCLGMTDHKCKWPRGKVMGGSSVLNFMTATRGNRKDYDRWANSTADQSWAYKEMLQYLKKLEHFDAEGAGIDESFHNRNGPLHISTSLYYSNLAEAFIDGHKELGIPLTDYNGRDQVGVAYSQINLKNRERWSVNRGYLYPAKGRKNLFLTRNSHVSKILIDNDTKSAYGVQFTKNNKIVEVRSKKEVILSAGAIGSPQILMLSGIGPAKHLHDLDIHVIKDSPVGENLMDHIAYSGLVFKVNDSETYTRSDIFDSENPVIRDYLNERKGPLTLAPAEVLSYLSVDSENLLSDYPDIELIFGSSSGILDARFSKALSISNKYQSQFLAHEFNQSTYMMLPMILRPKSRGKLLLRSKNPNDKPKLYANYLDDPEDVRVLIKGIRAAIQISKTKAFQKYGSELFDIPLPCNDFDFDSDAYWECALRTYSITIYHYTGTCKMGKRNDPTAVVDSDLRVIGIKGLRVADGSIMPEIVSAHTHIPIVAIGEKISDQIKKDWNFSL